MAKVCLPRRTVLIEEGILKGYLYDSYTAGKEGVPSTGNAVRSGYSDVPRVGIRNLIVSSPDARDLLAETKGYLVNGLIGAHTANPISGDFSVEARNAFFVAPGEDAKPIRSLMLAGNFFELLKDIEIGRDVRAVGGHSHAHRQIQNEGSWKLKVIFDDYWRACLPASRWPGGCHFK